jgi:hypothetical protein
MMPKGSWIDTRLSIIPDKTAATKNATVPSRLFLPAIFVLQKRSPIVVAMTSPHARNRIAAVARSA